MDKVTCSLCFTMDRRTINITNTHLHQVYEKLSGCAIQGALFLCFVCHTRLQQCHQFCELVHRTESVFENIGNNHKVFNKWRTQKSLVELCTANVVNISILLEEPIIRECDIKTEDDHASENKETEINEFDRSDDFTRSSDSEDDVPLNDIRIKEELENGERNNTEVGQEEIETGIEETEDKETSELEINEFDRSDDFTKNSDSEDDVPLNDIRIKQELENGERNGVEIETEIEETEGKETSKLEINEFDRSDNFTRSSDSEDDVPLNDRIKQNLENGERNKTEARQEEIETGIEGTEDTKISATEITLSEAEQLAELQQRAESGNYVHSPYKCALCYRGFVDPLAYDKHREKHDERAGEHECAVCHLRYVSGRQLRAHAAAAHARRYLCARCPHRSHTRNQAKEHERWHLGHTYRCEPCGLQFTKPTTYMTHVRKRHAGTHACARCGESFASAHGLRLHTAKTHARDQTETTAPGAEASEGAAGSRCAECGLRFHSEAARRRHVLTAPAHALWTDTGVCALCGEEVRAGERVAHARTHRAELAPRAHPPPAPRSSLRCEQCGATSSSASNLRAHVRRVHLGVRADRPVVCELCGARCTSNATLRYHQRRHTGERPHACACGARFALAAALRVHARTHSGERPYRCTVCGKRFTQKPALNKHYRVHTGAKPYECQFCARAFSQTNSLKVHVRAVHHKLPPNNRKKIDKTKKDTTEPVQQ